MHTLLLTILLLITLPARAEIYQQQGPEGMSYTDRPNPSDPAVVLKADDLPAINTIAIQATGVEAAAENRPAQAKVYSELAIKVPVDDAIIRDNAGNVLVNVTIVPDIHIKHGHQLVLYMDHQPIAHSASPIIQLTNLDRGSHTLQAQIQSAQGKVIQESAQILFHLQRYHLGQ